MKLLQMYAHHNMLLKKSQSDTVKRCPVKSMAIIFLISVLSGNLDYVIITFVADLKHYFKYVHSSRAIVFHSAEIDPVQCYMVL